MAGKRGHSSNRPAVSGPQAPAPEALHAELRERLDALGAADPSQQGALWGAIHRLLLRSKADRAEIGRAIARRDPEAVRQMLSAPDPSQDGGGALSDAPSESDAAASPMSLVDEETRKKALRAFRKRLKLTRLDHESRLGVGPLSGGKRAEVDAIIAPREFPQEVWEALVEDGRLCRAGAGFYMLSREENAK